MGTAPPAGTTGLTYQDLLALPDAGSTRYELLDGELLVTPAPTIRHQRAVGRISAALLAYTSSHGGEALVGPVDVYFADHTVFEPDVVALRGDHLDRIEERRVAGAPDLASMFHRLVGEWVSGLLVSREGRLAAIRGGSGSLKPGCRGLSRSGQHKTRRRRRREAGAGLSERAGRGTAAAGQSAGTGRARSRSNAATIWSAQGQSASRSSRMRRAWRMMRAGVCSTL